MRRYRNAKIVATLGPASDSPEMIRRLFEAGADVFRLNFSHGSHAEHAQRIAAIRALESEFGRPIGILTDLQGPKLRIGKLVGGTTRLAAGRPYRLDLSQEPGDDNRAPLPHPEVFAALEAGTDLLLDDGKLRLRVTECGEDYALTEIVTGGTLSDHKGVNVPNVVLPVSPLGAKDREDLSFALDQHVDWIGLSFVQRPEDVAEARKLVAGRAAILSKLEKPSAIERLEEIITLSDAVMVARGDLGVELPPEDVPSLQKQIIRACRQAGKPVVVATQMLESMINAPAPTRAEASDVATAVYDGADAVMLSAETAAGNYPVESVEMMERIVARVERDPLYRTILHAEQPDPEATAPDAITAAARQVAHTISAAAIVTFTTSGSTSLRAARERPDVPILCLTESLATARKLAIAWGIQCVVAEDVQDFSDMVDKACLMAGRNDFAKTGQRLVITAGVPFGTPGATNILRIAWIND
ncbi:MAG: pyruvate kinase [Alphaproteobacteria bacterium]